MKYFAKFTRLQSPYVNVAKVSTSYRDPERISVRMDVSINTIPNRVASIEAGEKILKENGFVEVDKDFDKHDLGHLKAHAPEDWYEEYKARTEI